MDILTSDYLQRVSSKVAAGGETKLPALKPSSLASSLAVQLPWTEPFSDSNSSTSALRLC